MDEPNWAIVLQALHEGELATGQEMGTGKGHTKYQIDDFSISETGLSEGETEDALEYLDNCGLITKYEIHSEEDSRLVGGLTEKGFDVAHERELTKSQHETSKRSARLSGLLVLAIIIQTSVSFVSTETDIISAVFGGLAILALLGWLSLEILQYGET